KTNHSVPIGRVLGFCPLLETLCILPLQFRLPRGPRFPVDSPPCSVFLLLALGFLLSPLRLLLSLQSLALSSLLSLQFLALSPLRGLPCLRVCCLFPTGYVLLLALCNEVVTKHNGGREQPSYQEQEGQRSFLHVRSHPHTSCKYLAQATCSKK